MGMSSVKQGMPRWLETVAQNLLILEGGGGEGRGG